jgi:hypothetical protein
MGELRSNRRTEAKQHDLSSVATRKLRGSRIGVRNGIELPRGCARARRELHSAGWGFAPFVEPQGDGEIGSMQA